MKMIRILSFLGWIGVVFPALSSAADGYVALTYKDEYLSKEMLSGKTMILPEFEIFDANGNRIFHLTGFDEGFENKVGDALSRVAIGKMSIDSVLSRLSTYDGQPLDRSILEHKDYVFVEYWAEWCLINPATSHVVLRMSDAAQAATRFAGNGCSIGKKRNKGMGRV